MKVQVAQKTHVGLIRRENQDNMGWFSLPGGELFIVADGMGGEAGGSTASQMAIAAIKETFEKGDASVSELLQSSIEEANRLIYDKGTSGDSQYYKMGTTVVVIFVRDDKAYIAHDGDSRIYLYRNNQLQRITKDHSQVQRMVDEGIISPEDAEDHPDSNIITRSVGTKPDIEVDIKPEPVQIMPDDIFLMCTDGLSGLVNDQEISAILKEHKSIEHTCETLVQTALDKGGDDNVTVQLIAFEGKPSVTTAPAQTSSQPKKIVSKESLSNKTFKTLSTTSLILISVLIGIVIAITGLFFWKGTDKSDKPKTDQQKRDIEKKKGSTEDKGTKEIDPGKNVTPGSIKEKKEEGTKPDSSGGDLPDAGKEQEKKIEGTKEEATKEEATKEEEKKLDFSGHDQSDTKKEEQGDEKEQTMDDKNKDESSALDNKSSP